MTPDQKPEWFQIADADNTVSPRKISKGLPVMALVAVAAILGIGAVVAQTQDESPANATETVAPAVVDTNQSSASSETTATDTQISTSDDSSAQAVPSTASKGSQDSETTAPSTPATPAASKTPAAGGVTNPLDKKPTGGEHEGGEGKHGGEHEGGDHEGGEDD